MNHEDVFWFEDLGFPGLSSFTKRAKTNHPFPEGSWYNYNNNADNALLQGKSLKITIIKYLHLTLFDPPPKKKNMGPLKNQPMFQALKKNERLYSYSQGTELSPSMSHEHKRPWPHSLKPNPVDPGQGEQTGPARTWQKPTGMFCQKDL